MRQIAALLLRDVTDAAIHITEEVRTAQPTTTALASHIQGTPLLQCGIGYRDNTLPVTRTDRQIWESTSIKETPVVYWATAEVRTDPDYDDHGSWHEAYINGAPPCSDSGGGGAYVAATTSYVYHSSCNWTAYAYMYLRYSDGSTRVVSDNGTSSKYLYASDYQSWIIHQAWLNE